MKISKNTLAILKNYSTINKGLIIKPGKVLRTTSPVKDIFAEVTLAEEFPVEFGIYDLPTFINTLSLFADDAELEFSDNKVLIKDDAQKMTFYSCSPKLLAIAFPDDDSNLRAKPDFQVKLSEEQVERIQKLAEFNGLPNVSLVGLEDRIVLRAHNIKEEATNDSSNFAEVIVSTENEHGSFVATWAKENLKMIPMDYNVGIHLNRFSVFENVDGSMRYFIVMRAA